MTVINTNTASINAQYNLSKVNKEMESAMEALSSGKRINSAADDAAGLSIATRMESQVRGLNQAMRNAADGQSMVDTAEGAMDEITNMLQRMRELALQSASDTNSAQDRENLNLEIDALTAEIDRVVSTTSFNETRLLDGSGNFNLQIGSNAGENLNFSIGNMSTNSLGSLTGAAAAGAVTSASVSGTEAETTKTQMTFNGDDTYKFELSLTTADGTGVYQIEADVTNGSAQDVVNKINEAIRDSSITGNTYQADTASSVVASYSGNVVTIENSYGGAITADQSGSDAFSESGSTITFTSVNGGTVTTASNVTLGTANSFAATTIENSNSYTAATAATIGITESGTLTAADVYELVLDDGAGNTLTVTGAAVGASPAADDGLTTITTAFDALTDQKGYSMAIASNTLTITREDGVDFSVALGASSSSNTGTLTEDETATPAVLTTTAVTTTDGVEQVGDEISNMYLEFTSGDTYTLNFTDSAATANETGTFDVVYDGSESSLNAIASVIGTQIDGNFASTHDVTVSVEAGRIKISDANGLSFALEDFASVGNGKVMASVDAGQGTVAAGDGVLLDDTTHATTGTTAAAGTPTASLMAMTFSGNDRFSFNISDGTATAVVSNFAADIATTATTGNIAAEINSALTKAGLGDIMTAAADSTTAGVVTLTHVNGKQIDISEFRSESTHTIKIEAPATLADLDNDGAVDDLANTGFTKFLDDGNGASSDVLSNISILSQSLAADAIDVIDRALEDINVQRSELGAVSNRLDHTISNLGNIVVNTEASQSRIEDADFAKVTGDLTKAQIMSQAATAMLAQANASKQGVLSLLQG